MSRSPRFRHASTNARLFWLAALLSLFMVFVLPGSSSGVLVAWLEPAHEPNNTNEEREEREQGELAEVAHSSSRKHPQLGAHRRISPRRFIAFHVQVVASVGPRPDPSQFFERRLQ